MIRKLLYQLASTGARTPGVRLVVYAAEAARFGAFHDRGLRVKSLLTEYHDWRKSQKQRRKPLDEQEPWLTFGAIQFLAARLDSKAEVFEFGSGGSTVFFGLRAGRVVSVEHDLPWAEEVNSVLRSLGLTNCSILRVPPCPDRNASAKDPRDPSSYLSTDPRFANQSFKAYASSIDSFADGHFRLILVDGRARPSCCLHAIPKLAPGGAIVLDNAERPEYAWIAKSLDQLAWPRNDFSGPGPSNRHFWKTTAWIRPA